MKSFAYLLLFCWITITVMYSQQNAVTDDGRKVILKNDGSWEYLKTDSTKTSSNSFMFRKAKWGLTKKQVKSTEKGKIERDDERILAYDGKISGIDCYIVYIFAYDKLVRARYVFYPTHSNKNDYISDYSTIKTSLIEKYGTPKSDDKYWRNDLYRNDYNDWGFAVSLGHLSYLADWDLETTEINVMLSGENYKFDLVAEYSSKELKYLEKKIIDEQKQSEF